MRFVVGRAVLAACIAVTPLGVGAQTGQVTGVVHSTDGRPVAGTLVTLDTDQMIATTRTDGSGVFRFDNVVEGRHELRVTFPGYSPWVRFVDVKEGATVSVDVVFRPSVQMLDSVVVSATRTGVFGMIGDMTTLAPLDSAVVQVIGFRSADTTSDGGRFQLDRVQGGRSYVVRVSRPGYETRAISISVPSKGGFELTAFLDPGSERRTNNEGLWREFDNRLNYGGMSAALITRADLGGLAKSSLEPSLLRARPLIMKGLRLHPRALQDPMSPTYPCIYVNGRLASRFTLLDQFEVGEIVAIEAYGYGTLQWDRLAGKLSLLMKRSPACGVPPTRSQVFEGPTPGSPGLRTRPVSEPYTKESIGVIVIWLRQ